MHIDEETRELITKTLFPNLEFLPNSKTGLQALALTSYTNYRTIDVEDLANILIGFSKGNIYDNCAQALAGVLSPKEIQYLDNVLIRKAVDKLLSNGDFKDALGTFARGKSILISLLTEERKQLADSSRNFQKKYIVPFVDRLFKIAKKKSQILNAGIWSFDLCKELAAILYDFFTTLVVDPDNVDKERVEFPNFVINNAIAIKQHVEKLIPLEGKLVRTISELAHQVRDRDRMVLVLAGGYLFLRFLNGEIVDYMEKKYKRQGPIKDAFANLCTHVLISPLQTMANDLGVADHAEGMEAEEQEKSSFQKQQRDMVKIWTSIAKQLFQNVEVDDLVEQYEEGLPDLVFIGNAGFTPADQDILVNVEPEIENKSKPPERPKAKLVKDWPLKMKLFLLNFYKTAQHVDLADNLPLVGHDKEKRSITDRQYIAINALISGGQKYNIVDTSGLINSFEELKEAVATCNSLVVGPVLEENPQAITIKDSELFIKVCETFLEIKARRREEKENADLESMLDRIYSILEDVFYYGVNGANENDYNQEVFSNQILPILIKNFPFDIEQIERKRNPAYARKYLMEILDNVSACSDSYQIEDELEKQFFETAAELKTKLLSQQKSQKKERNPEKSDKLEIFNLFLFYLIHSPRNSFEISVLVKGVTNPKIQKKIISASYLRQTLVSWTSKNETNSPIGERINYLTEACYSNFSFVLFYIRKRIKQMNQAHYLQETNHDVEMEEINTNLLYASDAKNDLLSRINAIISVYQAVFMSSDSEQRETREDKGKGKEKLNADELYDIDLDEARAEDSQNQPPPSNPTSPLRTLQPDPFNVPQENTSTQAQQGMMPPSKMEWLQAFWREKIAGAQGNQPRRTSRTFFSTAFPWQTTSSSPRNLPPTGSSLNTEGNDVNNKV
jgi:hypothetical protein